MGFHRFTDLERFPDLGRLEGFSIGFGSSRGEIESKRCAATEAGQE